MTRYCFDSSSFLWAERRKHPLYPCDVFPSLWRELETMVTAGKIFVCQEAYDEMAGQRKQTDTIAEWLRERKKQSPRFVVPTDQQKQRAVEKIIRDFPKLIGGADAYLIAHAKVERAAVVSEETPKGNDSKIPDVCGRLNVRCLYLVDFMRENGIIFPHIRRP